MSEHYDSKPGQIRWTDDEILGALEEMNKRLPSGAHSAIAVMRMMRDSYEITRQSANRHIASQEARITELEARLEGIEALETQVASLRQTINDLRIELSAYQAAHNSKLPPGFTRQRKRETND